VAIRQSIRDFIANSIIAIGSKITRIFQDPKYFELWEKHGFHLTPVSFSEPTPDTRDLKDELWNKHSEIVGVDINESVQIELLSRFATDFKNEYEQFPSEKTDIPHQYYLRNPYFISVDGEILYCMIRHFKPRRVLEIGSGNSTYLSAQALRQNEAEGFPGELTAFEPYPNNVLKAGFPGLSRLVEKRVENVRLSEFATLQERDILFIDSSHTLKIGSDVYCEFLEIIPRLNKGVVIHVHDIFLPAEYPKDWFLKDHNFYNEQYLLQAFLAFNESFEVIWAGSFMHLKHPDKLKAAFDSYEGGWPGSLWMRKTK
jgi:predicted O-methyltransferase YrrM